MLLHVVVLTFHLRLQLAEAHRDFSVLRNVLRYELDIFEGAC